MFSKLIEDNSTIWRFEILAEQNKIISSHLSIATLDKKPTRDWTMLGIVVINVLPSRRSREGLPLACKWVDRDMKTMSKLPVIYRTLFSMW